jgi:steroid 5-alpha reductase family enzyme
MNRFLAYWLLAFVLTLPSWWIVAAHGMASGRDLLWTAGFAAFLATVLCLGERPAASAVRADHGGA